MKFQFKNHDMEVHIPEGYENLFKTKEQLKVLESLLFSLPPFQNVEEGAELLPILGSSMFIPTGKAVKIGPFELALMEMIESGQGQLSEPGMLMYIMRKVKEIDLAMKGYVVVPEEPKSGGGLIL